MALLSETEIHQIEERFQLVLPPFYRAYLLEHDPARELRDFGSGPLGECELLADAKELIRVNERVRNPELWYFGEHPWPERFFVIGEDVYGCHYFVDTSGQYPGVRFEDIYDWDIAYVADDCLGLIEHLKWKSDDE